MYSALFIAGVLCIILGLVHSVMGEALIFRAGKISAPGFRGIIWASWHLASLLGFALSAVFFSISPEVISSFRAPLLVIALCLAIGGGLVLWATKGRHPGWAVLWVIAACVYIGAD